MEILIFRTDIKTKKKVKYIHPILSRHTQITDWNIELEDIDNVLRIESHGLQEQDIIKLVKIYGFYIEPL